MVIGVTGSIATGKSTVTKYLLELGYPVIDSDKIVHNLLMNNEIIQEIEKEFGKDYIIDGVVVRSELAKLIFNDEEARQKLNSIVHPKVINKINEQIKNYSVRGSNLIFVDIPLLYEEGLEYLVDRVIVVRVSEEIQLTRLVKRDNINKAFAMKKIAATISIEEKLDLADYVIDNSQDITNTKREVDVLLRRLLNEI